VLDCEDDIGGMANTFDYEQWEDDFK